MKQLFVTDLDGTLLSTDSRVSPKSAHIISELTRRGALITVATARTPATVEPLLRNTLTTPPAIVMTGAALWDRKTRSYIRPRLMTPEMAAEATAACRENGLNPMTYTIGRDNRLHVYVHGALSKKEQKFIDERTVLELKRFHLLPAEAAPECYPDTIVIFAVGPIAQVEAAAAKIKNDTDYSIPTYPDIFDPTTGMTDIFAPGVSKAEAVLELKELTGADELIVFGDNINDLPMMAVADRAIAVANALPEVRAAAHETIGPNSTDSVTRYIAENFKG